MRLVNTHTIFTILSSKIIMKEKETLESLFKRCQFDKADLLDNADLMGYNTNKELENLTLPKLRKQLAKSILDDPKPLLRQLPYEDLMLLHILKDAEPGLGMSAHRTSQIMSMAFLGIAEQVVMNDDETMEMISITEDFKQAIRPCLNEVANAFEVKLRLRVEQFLIGALNLYGVLTLSELKAILKECFDLEDDGSGMFDHIYSYSITLKLQEYDGYFYDGEDFFISPFVHDYDHIFKEREKLKDITSLKHFDCNTLEEAGQMPVPDIPNPTTKKLLQTLQKKLGFTEQEAYFQRFLIWQNVQGDRFADVLQTVMGNAPKKMSSINEMNEVVQVLMEFMNNAPRWIFRGRCPSDLQKPLTSPPTIDIGPNLKSMGIRQEDVQRMANEKWEQRHTDYNVPMIPFLTRHKVGRNDPCPCGSGKKYKNCCGRGNVDN